MQILLANAKIMFDKSATAPKTVPIFQKTAEMLAHEMSLMDTDDAARQLGCNRKLAAKNILRYHNFLSACRMPAIMAYNGQAYKHLQAHTLNAGALDFAQQHLWITCFLYGILRPMDGIVPYRMEHTVRLDITDNKPIYQYWKDKLTGMLIDSVKKDDNTLLHLSTAEYEHLFDWKRVCREVNVIQPLFYIRKGNELKVQPVWSKTCRGAMTRFILENKITCADDLHAFSYKGFEYDAHIGETAFPHFIRNDEM